MQKDPIIEEVRKNRDEIAKENNYDLEMIFKYIIKKQKSCKHKLVSFLNKKN